MKKNDNEIDEEYIYKTMATVASDKYYENAKVIHEYDNMKEAQYHYTKDMDEWRTNNPGSHYQYCIRKEKREVITK